MKDGGVPFYGQDRVLRVQSPDGNRWTPLRQALGGHVGRRVDKKASKLDLANGWAAGVMAVIGPLCLGPFFARRRAPQNAVA